MYNDTLAQPYYYVLDRMYDVGLLVDRGSGIRGSGLLIDPVPDSADAIRLD